MLGLVSSLGSLVDVGAIIKTGLEEQGRPFI